MIKRKPAIGSRRYMTHLRGHYGSPSYIALVDLFFLLLLFIFMSSSVVRLSGIPIELPKLRAPYFSGLGKLVVTITAPQYGQPCRIYYRDRQLSIDELRQEFSKLDGDRSSRYVIIRADRSVPSGVLDEVILTAREANLKSFLAVQVPSDKPETHFE